MFVRLLAETVQARLQERAVVRWRGGRWVVVNADTGKVEATGFSSKAGAQFVANRINRGK